MHPGPRDPHVQEAALLGEGRVVLLRLADRQDPLLQARQEHGVPLEALRPVVGQQVDAAGRALALVGGARLEVRDDGRGIGGRVRGGDPVDDRQQRLERRLALARLVALGGPVLLVAHGLGPAGADGVGEVRAARPRSGAAGGWPARSAPPAGRRSAGRAPGRRRRPASAPPRSAPAGRSSGPARRSRRGRSPRPAAPGSRPRAPPAPAPPRACLEIVGSGPSPRVATRRLARPSAAISRLASSSTWGVER